MKRALQLLVLVMLLLVTAWIIVHRNDVPRSVQVAVVDVTHDAAGTRRMSLSVSNAGSYAVWLAPSWVLERDVLRRRSDTILPWRTNLMQTTILRLDINFVELSLSFWPRSKKLEAGDCYILKHSIPCNDSRWRATLSYDRYDRLRPGLRRVLTSYLHHQACRLGLWRTPLRDEVTELAGTPWIER